MSRQMKGLAPTGTEDHMGKVLPACNACRWGMLGLGTGLRGFDLLDRPFAAGGAAGGGGWAACGPPATRAAGDGWAVARASAGVVPGLAHSPPEGRQAAPWREAAAG